jgi:hypothetical protein
MFVLSQMNDLHLLSIRRERRSTFGPERRGREVPSTYHLSNEAASIGKVALLELFVVQCREKPNDNGMKVMTTIDYSICHNISLNNYEKTVKRKKIRMV